MDRETAIAYLSRAYRSEIDEHGGEIESMMKKADRQGTIQESGFVNYYYDMASKKPKKFFKHLKSNFIRKDLVRLMDAEFPSQLTVQQMPR